MDFGYFDISTSSPSDKYMHLIGSQACSENGYTHTHTHAGNRANANEYVNEYMRFVFASN